MSLKDRKKLLHFILRGQKKSLHQKDSNFANFKFSCQKFLHPDENLTQGLTYFTKKSKILVTSSSQRKLKIDDVTRILMNLIGLNGTASVFFLILFHVYLETTKVRTSLFNVLYCSAYHQHIISKALSWRFLIKNIFLHDWHLNLCLHQLEIKYFSTCVAFLGWPLRNSNKVILPKSESSNFLYIVIERLIFVCLHWKPVD